MSRCVECDEEGDVLNDGICRECHDHIEAEAAQYEDEFAASLESEFDIDEEEP